MFKKLTSAALAALVALSCGAAASAEGYPTAEGESFRIFVKQQSIQPNYEDIYTFKKYEEMTGIHIDWINTPQDVTNEKVSLTLASGDLPDAFMKCNISASNLLTYGDAGDFLDLSPYLEEYAPNFWAYATANPDVMAAITTPDGAIYSLPAIADAPSTRINVKWFYNQEWLDNLGLSQPTTIDELYDVLVAFKTQDANGNGDPNDEVPIFTEMNNIYSTFAGLFGCLNRGGYHQNSWDADPVTGEVRYVRTSDAWREMLTFLNKLYAEGLISQECITYTVSDCVALASQDRLGIYCMTNLARLSDDVAAKYSPMNSIIEGPHGDKLWVATRSHLHSVGSFVITTACKNPELLLQWIDYFYSDEGVRFYHYGTVGETCVQNDDGSFSFSADVLAPMAEGKSYDQAAAAVSSYGGGNNPTIMSWPGFCGAELTEKPMAASDVLKDYLPEIVWPILNYTSDENEIVTTIGSDIDTYVKGMCAKFITGEESLDDANWAKYVSTVESMGLDQYQQAVAASVARAEATMNK